MSEAFDAEFNAPQFIDFEEIRRLEEEGRDVHEADKSMAEQYFDFDHENGIPVDIPLDISENNESPDPPSRVNKFNLPQVNKCDLAQGDLAHGLPSSSSTSSSILSSALADRIRNEETPNRERIMDEVAKTIASVENSPQLVLPTRNNTPKMAKTSLNLSTGKVSKPNNSSSLSPALMRWKKAVKAMTPEVLKKARLHRMKEQTENHHPLGNVPKISVMESSNRLASKSTSASKSRADEIKAEKLAKCPTMSNNAVASSSNSYKHKVTHVAPFNFATDQRSKPMKAVAGNVDLARMIDNYNESHKGHKSDPNKTSHRRRSKSFSSTLGRLRKAGSNRSINNETSATATASSDSSNATTLKHHQKTDVRPFSFVDQDLEKTKKRLLEAKKAVDSYDFLKSLRTYPSHEQTHHVAPSGPTKPQPFSFLSRPLSSDRRRRSRSADNHNNRSELSRLDDKSSRIIKAKPMPHHGIPVVLANLSKKSTTLKPFSFEQRDQGMLQKKQEKIEKILEQEKKEREFKANPMPDLHKPVGLPVKEPLMPTKAMPFKHEIEKRVGARIQKFQQEIEEEMERMRETSRFKANPPTVLEKEPFIPAKSDKPLSEVSNFELHSDKRAREREDFECRKKHREAELESYKRQLEERKKYEEEEEIKRLRKEIVHKAQPVKKSRPIEIHHSDKPLTEAHSPNFSKRFNK